MDSLLAILCIIFFSVLIYGVVYGHNLTKKHGTSCRIIYIPEDVDPKILREQLVGLDKNKLKKKAWSLGISRVKVDTMIKNDLIKLILMKSADPTRIIMEGLDKR